MIYVESDFFLALIKSEDWLKKKAIEVEREHKGELVTSIITIAEALLSGKKYNLDAENIVSSIFELAKVEGMSLEEAMEIAHLVKDEKVGVFDAFHAVLSRDLPVASSEKVYDRIGRERIKLEGE